MKRYFVSPDGTSAIMGGSGPLGDAAIPDGYREVTAEEYAAALEAGRAEADARAAAFIANDGAPGEEDAEEQPA